MLVTISVFFETQSYYPKNSLQGEKNGQDHFWEIISSSIQPLESIESTVSTIKLSFQPIPLMEFQSEKEKINPTNPKLHVYSRRHQHANETMQPSSMNQNPNPNPYPNLNPDPTPSLVESPSHLQQQQNSPKDPRCHNGLVPRKSCQMLNEQELVLHLSSYRQSCLLSSSISTVQSFSPISPK